MFSVPVLLDFLLIGLLVVTITFCLRLNKKLTVMRNAQSELHKVAEEFDRAIVRSKLGVEELKKTSMMAGAGLKKETAEAQTLLEELKLINASSSRIADRLQEEVGNASRKAKASSGRAHSNEEFRVVLEDPDPEEIQPRTEAERELLQMLTKSK